MILPKIIFYISLFVWLLPPLKQFRGRFFYYFLLQALSDPLAFILVENNIYYLPFYLVKDLFLVLLFWKPDIKKKKILYLMPLFLLIFIAAGKIQYNIMHNLIAGVHGIIIYLIFKMFLNDVLEIKKIKIFYILILLYELSVVQKFVYAIIHLRMGGLYYSITTAFEILLGILFIFVREDSTRFAITIMNVNDGGEEQQL